ncbi:glycine-rich RNA-binding protein 4, mitochondrial isoform X1 [Vigna unguiculata]|uniref:glycine-rich RNA-binding protein 4, mitochondrial isoform X1 n=1 Tax=Vigna unguiculata TaxID=3917 RepID=UPI0010168829|nr:glycine-rich RNA-binding protein 4, mitochondrial isoform X1 [Vigna unguiculata]
MAQQVLLNSCPPQHVSLQRFRILKPSIWVTKPNIVSSPSVSTSAPLRCVSFCCNSSATSSVESNLPSSAKIFVKGLPHSTSEGRLMKVFSEFGVVNLVQLPIDEESGKSLGFAFIWFVKEESAQLAVQEMNGKFFDGRFIYVTIAKPGPSNNSKRTTAYKF